MEFDGEWLWDAADGGTTATIAVVLPDRLVVAAVGDSSVLLLGRAWDGTPTHQVPWYVTICNGMKRYVTVCKITYMYVGDPRGFVGAVCNCI